MALRNPCFKDQIGLIWGKKRETGRRRRREEEEKEEIKPRSRGMEPWILYGN